MGTETDSAPLASSLRSGGADGAAQTFDVRPFDVVWQTSRRQLTRILLALTVVLLGGGVASGFFVAQGHLNGGFFVVLGAFAAGASVFPIVLWKVRSQGRLLAVTVGDRALTLTLSTGASDTLDWDLPSTGVLIDEVPPDDPARQRLAQPVWILSPFPSPHSTMGPVGQEVVDAILALAATRGLLVREEQFATLVGKGPGSPYRQLAVSRWIDPGPGASAPPTGGDAAGDATEFPIWRSVGSARSTPRPDRTTPIGRLRITTTGVEFLRAKGAPVRRDWTAFSPELDLQRFPAWALEATNPPGAAWLVLSSGPSSVGWIPSEAYQALGDAARRRGILTYTGKLTFPAQGRTPARTSLWTAIGGPPGP